VALASILVPHFTVYLWTFQWKRGIFLGVPIGKDTDAQRSEVLQGTLDLMVLKVLDALGPQHGYGIARRIEQVSEQVLQLNEGTVYTSLLRLGQRGMDRLRLGDIGEQSQGQVLFDHQKRP
jgi:Transcriptional regulator PadR-like family